MSETAATLTTMVAVRLRGEDFLLTTDEAEKLFFQLRNALYMPMVDGEEIEASVSRAFSILQHKLKGDERPARIVHPRHVAMWLYTELTGKSLREIGERFPRANGNGRGHDTVIHACKHVRTLIRKKHPVGLKALLLKKELMSRKK